MKYKEIPFSTSNKVEEVPCPVCNLHSAIWETRRNKEHELASPRGYIKVATPCESCTEIFREQDRQEHRIKVAEFHAKQVQERLELSNIPKTHRTASLSDFRPEFISRVQSTPSMLVTGPVGCGKTHLAIALMREDMLAKKEILFKDISELMMEIRSTFDKNHPGELTESMMVDLYSSVECLYLDDLGAEKVSEWALVTFRIIINRRWGNELKTVVTTNLDSEKIELIYGDRVSSRLFGLCPPLKMTGKDRRMK